MSWQTCACLVRSFNHKCASYWIAWQGGGNDSAASKVFSINWNNVLQCDEKSFRVDCDNMLNNIKLPAFNENGLVPKMGKLAGVLASNNGVDELPWRHDAISVAPWCPLSWIWYLFQMTAILQSQPRARCPILAGRKGFGVAYTFDSPKSIQSQLWTVFMHWINTVGLRNTSYADQIIFRVNSAG